MTTPNNLDDFSKREIEIIKLSTKGQAISQIAEQLNLSKHTIRRHKENIADKAGTNGSCELRQFLQQIAPLLGEK